MNIESYKTIYAKVKDTNPELYDILIKSTETCNTQGTNLIHVIVNILVIKTTIYLYVSF